MSFGIGCQATNERLRRQRQKPHITPIIAVVEVICVIICGRPPIALQQAQRS
jgi:hypothetical protein